MSFLRRYEILLPKRFNDGTPVPGENFSDTAAEIRDQFGAISWETQVIQGEWEYRGVVYRDELVRLVVDVPPSSEARQFFVEFKEKLKARFNQAELWVTAFEIERI